MRSACFPLIHIQMASIHNHKIIQNLIDKAKLQLAVDKIPTELAEKILPVLEITPQKKIISAYGTLTDATSTNVMTTSSTKKTFLIGYQISLSKDVVNDATLIRILATAKGLASNAIFAMRIEPTLAQSGIGESVILPFPMEIEKNTNISVAATDDTASIDVSCILFYYEEEEN